MRRFTNYSSLIKGAKSAEERIRRLIRSPHPVPKLPKPTKKG